LYEENLTYGMIVEIALGESAPPAHAAKSHALDGIIEYL